ncbi:MAG: T9SS type A sorting domain-containing protein [Bacteroidota bacterium]
MKKRNLLLSVTTLLVFGCVVLFASSHFNQSGRYIPRKSFEKQNAQGITDALNYLQNLRVNKATGVVDPNDILKAQQQLIAMRQQKSGNTLGLTFIERGPDNVGGRTRAILVRKSNSNIVFAGAVGGGLWKSTTGGSSWTKVSYTSGSSVHLNNDNLAVSCITESANGDIYFGTGEGLAQNGGSGGDANGSSSIIGQGMWKSTDGGATFTQLPSTVPTAANSTSTPWVFINRVAADPSNNNRIYAATNKGLRMSDDGGLTWVNPIKLTATAYLQLPSSDVKVGSDGSVVAVVGAAIYLSNNGNADSYTKATNGLPASAKRIEVAIAPSDPGYIYASIAKSDGSLDGVYRSINKGLNWVVIGPGGSSSFELFGSNNQGWYDNVIAVYPNNKNKIIAGGVDMFGWEENESWIAKTLWNANSPGSNAVVPYYIHADQHAYVFDPNNPNIIYVGSDGGLNKSIDGGQTWRTINKNYNVTQFYTTASGAYSEVIGGTQDNGTLLIDGTGNTMLNARHVYGGDGSWACMSIINPKAVFASTYNASFGRSVDKGNTFAAFDKWTTATPPVANPAAGFIAPMVLWESFNNPYSKDSVTFTNTDSTNVIAAGSTITVRSRNGGYPFPYQTPVQIGTVTSPNKSIRVKDIVATKFFVGYTGAIYMTKGALDFTTTVPDWYKIATISGTPQYMAYTKDGDNLFVGTDEGSLYRISNLLQAEDSATADVGNTSTCVLTTKLIGTYNQAVTSISVDPLDGNKVLVTLGNYGSTSYVYYSTNALAATPIITSKQGNLPQMPVYSSCIVLNHGNQVILGTEMGVFATDNITANPVVWSEESDGIGNVPVFMIFQQTMNRDAMEVGGTIYPAVNNYGSIYFGTHGRGFFECRKFVGIKDIDSKESVSKPQLKIYPNPVKDNATIEYNLYSNSDVIVKVYSLNGTEVDEFNLGNKTSGNYTFNINTSSYRTGTYIVSINANNLSKSAKMMVTK